MQQHFLYNYTIVYYDTLTNHRGVGRRRLSSRGSLGGDSAKLLLTTGLCGGFTTFSTFCNENLSLMRGGHALATLLYTSGSVVLGFIAVAVGYWIAEKL